MDRNKILRMAKNEYVKWITNPKMIILVVMLIFAYDYVILELSDAADKMNVNIQIFEGFIGISNSQVLIMIIPIVFIGLMGDFPRTDGNSMLYIYRIGKTNWLMGQVLFLVMASVTYLVLLIGFSIVTLAGKSYFSNKWSEVTTKYYLFAPNDYESIVAKLTTGRLYNNLKPTEAMANIVVLMFLLMILISMMLLVAFICKRKIAGMVITIGIMCMGNVFAYMENNIRWIFPSSHAILEIHFDEIYKEPVMDMCWSYMYYILGIAVLFIIALVNVDKYDFSKIQELEE